MVKKTQREKLSKARDVVADLIEEEVKKQEEPHQIRPGEVNAAGVKTAWTIKALEEAYGICEFTPDETVPVTVSGVRVQLFDGITMAAPCCFRDVWLKSREARRGRTTSRTLAALGIEKSEYSGTL